jgi:hypothetical protein
MPCCYSKKRLSHTLTLYHTSQHAVLCTQIQSLMDASGHGHLMLHDKRTRDISLGVTGGWEQDEDETEVDVGKTGSGKTVNGSTAGGAATSFSSSVSSSTSDTTAAAAGGTGGSGATTMTDRARRLLSISSLPDGAAAAAGKHCRCL